MSITDDLLREAITTYQNEAAEFGDPDAVAQAAAALDGDKAALREISPALKIRVAADIPASRAWKAGRRVYVQSAYGSPLGNKLYEVGSTWDSGAGARWFAAGAKGDAKLQVLLPLMREAEERTARVQGVKDAGHWLAIPIRAKEIREHAKAQLGAVWGGDARKEWAFPTAEARAEAAAMVAEYEAAHPQRKPAAGSRQPLLTQDGKCAECGQRRGLHERHDSSGIPGLVCDQCNLEPSYVLSFA